MDPRAPNNRILQYYNPNQANLQAAIQNAEVAREEARPADANQALAIIHSDCIPVLVPVEWREVNFEQIAKEPDLFYCNKRRQTIKLYYVAPNENVNGEAVERVRFFVERMATVYVAVPNDNEAKQQQDKSWRVPPWLVKIVKSLNEEQFIDIIDKTKETEFLDPKTKVESKNCTRLECFHHEYVTAYYARYLDDDVDLVKFKKNLEKIHRKIKCECNLRQKNRGKPVPFVQNQAAIDESADGEGGEEVTKVEVDGKVQEAQVVQEEGKEEVIPQENPTDANNYAQKEIGEVSDISGPIAAEDEIGNNKLVNEIVGQNVAPIHNNNLIAQANPIDEFDNGLENQQNIDENVENKVVEKHDIQENYQNNPKAQNVDEDNQSGNVNDVEDQSAKMNQTTQDNVDQRAPSVDQNSLNGNSDKDNDQLQEGIDGFDQKSHSNKDFDNEDENIIVSKSENLNDSSFDPSSQANEEKDKVEEANLAPKSKISDDIFDSPPQSNEKCDDDKHEDLVSKDKILKDNYDPEIDKSYAENGGSFESPPHSSDEYDHDEIPERKVSNGKSQANDFDEDYPSNDNDLSNDYNAGETPQSNVPNDEDMEVEEAESDSLPPPMDEEDVPYEHAEGPESVETKNPTESDVPDDDSEYQSEPDDKADIDDKSDSDAKTESYNEADSDDDTIEDGPAGQANLNVENANNQVIEIEDDNLSQNDNVPVVNHGKMFRGFNQNRAQKRKAVSDIEHKDAKRPNTVAAQARAETKEDWRCKQIVYQENDDVVMKWDPKEWEGEPTRTTMDKINKAPEVLRMHLETHDHYHDEWVESMKKATNYQNELKRIRLMASHYNLRTSTDPLYHSFIERFFRVLKQSDEKYRIKVPTFAHVPELHRWHVYSYMRYLECRKGIVRKVNGSSPSYGYEHFKTICEQIGNKESIEDFPTG